MHDIQGIAFILFGVPPFLIDGNKRMRSFSSKFRGSISFIFIRTPKAIFLHLLFFLILFQDINVDLLYDIFPNRQIGQFDYSRFQETILLKLGTLVSKIDIFSCLKYAILTKTLDSHDFMVSIVVYNISI